MSARHADPRHRHLRRRPQRPGGAPAGQGWDSQSLPEALAGFDTDATGDGSAQELNVPDQWPDDARRDAEPAPAFADTGYDAITSADEALAAMPVEIDPTWPDPLDPVIPVPLSAGTVLDEDIAPPDAPLFLAAADPEVPEPPLDLSGGLLFASPGWVLTVEAARVANGEWDNIPEEFDGVHARTVAESVMTYRRAVRAIGQGWRNICLAAGRPDRIVPGWALIEELVTELEAEAERERRLADGLPVFAPKAALTRGQLVLRDEDPHPVTAREAGRHARPDARRGAA